MNKLILCEGETDAILLSYYLGKTAGWKFCKKPPANIAIKPDTFDQSANWYENGEDRLLICAMGGKDKVRAFFNQKILRPIVDAGAFSRIALVLDRSGEPSRVGGVKIPGAPAPIELRLVLACKIAK